MNPINKEFNASYNFVAPRIDDDADKKVEIVFPTVEVLEPSIVSNKTAVTVRREKTIIMLKDRAAATELKLLPDPANLNIGAVVVVSWSSDSTQRDVEVKMGEISVAEMSGEASKPVAKQLVWTGDTFLPIG